MVSVGSRGRLLGKPQTESLGCRCWRCIEDLWFGNKVGNGHLSSAVKMFKQI